MARLDLKINRGLITIKVVFFLSNIGEYKSGSGIQVHLKTLQSMMDAKLSQQRIWTFHKKGLIKTSSTTHMRVSSQCRVHLLWLLILVISKL